MADYSRINEDKLLAKAGLTRAQWISNSKLIEKIAQHIEHWKRVNKYDCPFDYVGLNDIINTHLKNLPPA